MPITMVSIPVADQARAKAFYTDVMGFALLTDAPMGRSRWIQLQPTGGSPAITLVDWFDDMPPGSQQGLMLAIDDIVAERDRLIAAGANPGEIRKESWGRYAMLTDPDGNRWIVATLAADA